MANVNFFRGSDTNVQQHARADGNFYFATDTNKIYIDVSKTENNTTVTEIHPLNYAASSHTHNASDITGGTLDAARIPNLSASKITSGTFDAARIPDLSGSYLPLSGGTVTGAVHLTRTTDASGIAANDPALSIGSYSGQHLEFDGNEVMCKSDGTTPSALFINADGGNVTLGGTYTNANNTDVTSVITARGPLVVSSFDGGTTNEARFQAATTNRTSNVIRVIGAADSNGDAVLLGDGGLTIVGGGEAANTMWDDLSGDGVAAGAERLVLAADSYVNIVSNVQKSEDYGSEVKTWTFSQAGNTDLPDGGTLTARNANIYMKSTDLDITANSVTARELYLGVHDTNDRYAVWVGGGQLADGTSRAKLYARRNNSGTNVDNGVTLSVDSSGNRSVSLSSPAAWLTALGLDDGPYLPLAGGTLTGNVTYNGYKSYYKATNITTTKPSSGTTYGQGRIHFTDNADGDVGIILPYWASSTDNRGLLFRAKRTVNNNTINNDLYLAVNNAGDPKVVLESAAWLTALGLGTSGALPVTVAQGGTGRNTLTSGSYLVGNGTGQVSLKTPAQVLTDIAALPLAGGTLTGSVTLDNSSIVIRDDDVTVGTAVSSNHNTESMAIKDSASNVIALYGGYFGTSGLTGARITAKNSSNAEHNLYIGWKNGSKYVSLDADAWSSALGGPFLPLAGGTLTGTVNNSGGHYYINRSNLNTSSTPTSAGTYYFGVKDKDDRYVGYFGAGQESGGASAVSIYARSYDGSSNVNHGIQLKVTKNGTRTVTVTDATSWRAAFGLGTDGALPITLAQGGTGATDAAGARKALGLGNTSTGALPVLVSQGGTGRTSLTADRILMGNGTSAVVLATGGTVNATINHGIATIFRAKDLSGTFSTQNIAFNSTNGSYANSHDDLFSRRTSGAPYGITCLKAGTVAVSAMARIKATAANGTSNYPLEVYIVINSSSAGQVMKAGAHIMQQNGTVTLTIPPVFTTVAANDYLSMQLYSSNSISIAANELYLSAQYEGV